MSACTLRNATCLFCASVTVLTLQFFRALLEPAQFFINAELNRQHQILLYAWFFVKGSDVWKLRLFQLGRLF